MLHHQHDLAHAEYRKSKHSQDANAACVEVARNLPGIVAVRDSKNPTGPALVFGVGEWRRFTTQMKDDRL